MARLTGESSTMRAVGCMIFFNSKAPARYVGLGRWNVEYHGRKRRVLGWRRLGRFSVKRCKIASFTQRKASACVLAHCWSLLAQPNGLAGFANASLRSRLGLRKLAPPAGQP